MRKTKLTLLLLAALLTGVCLGFFGNSAIIRARIARFSQIPHNMPQHITDKLTDRLDLDAAQQEKVLAVFMAYESRLQETREKSRAMFDELKQEMAAQIDQHLTPAQIEEHRKMLAELDQQRRADRALARAMGGAAGSSNAAPAPAK